MNIQKFTQKSMQAVEGCEKLAYEYGNQEIEQEHLLIFALQIIQQFLAFLKRLLQIIGDNIGEHAVLCGFALFLHFIGAHCSELPLYYLYSFARLNRGDIHGRNYRRHYHEKVHHNYRYCGEFGDSTAEDSGSRAGYEDVLSENRLKY